MDTLVQDLRYGLRALRRNPVFTAIAVTTIALGIGATTAIWSVASGVLLRPLPYPAPERLVMVWMDNTRLGLSEDWHSLPMVDEYRERSATIADIAVLQPTRRDLHRGRRARAGARGPRVREPVGRARRGAALGRTFTAAEDQTGRRRRRRAVARSLAAALRRPRRRRWARASMMNERPRRVLGVMPAGFGFPRRRYSVLDSHRAIRGSSAPAAARSGCRRSARLEPGRHARRRRRPSSQRINAGIQERYPSEKGFGVNVVGLPRARGRPVRPAILVLLGAVAFVLLIACANVASLLLARASTREREMALRAGDRRRTRAAGAPARDREPRARAGRRRRRPAARPARARRTARDGARRSAAPATRSRSTPACSRSRSRSRS